MTNLTTLPPPAYTQEASYAPRDSTYQEYNPQPQTYQAPPGSISHLPPGYPQGDQTPPATGHYDRQGGEYPAYQGASPGARDPYDHNRAGSGAVPQDRVPSPNGESRGLSLASFFGSTGPPPMWQRQPPQRLRYDQFPPMCLISNKTELSKGFPEVAPPCQLRVHPFATHDILKEDWKRFLADIKKAGSLSAGQRIKSNAIPPITDASLIGGFLMTGGIEKRMKAKVNNRNAAGDIVDNWNQYFFGPRRMEAVLWQGSERLSGREGAAPLDDYSQLRTANGLRRRASSSLSSSSSSSSSSDSEDDRSRNKHGSGSSASRKFDKRQRRAARKEARTEKRQEKRARKAERRSGKARMEHSEPYHLFIQAI
ncbi:uncharacterized protein F5147DRAFT_774445 [Suillus discolor]|uniref:Uncharacterized protein n=1 Tax=Suillus discolor TaxID=1912936 RepID=A0A9P7F6I4_9AGAM|nr:uncharacterized protein F5147DRAFT_774445 [Suillus discolor]KAG2107224.1 hypothetical protein F5147DRAFT_774445 [Suillus discolor]